MLSECDYLTYVIKESLRMDPPSMNTSPYMTYEEVEICGVKIPSKIKMMINVVGCHYNSDQWHEPTKFIPERFDPTSEYFLKPGTDDVRDPLAFIPFSTGKRSCPGMSFALTEMKVYLSFLISKFDYSIKPEMLSNPKVRFGLDSNYKLDIKIKKKH
ncbi:unnamed protein product [Moneuplotes crassus]|uniref:Cytochrome P450 n=1 Tax=Euplotes crassus TaxID=5936 RepID=A0AAD1XAW6_EUPCR|nr:unnamed protein product [Moneuplotes crassus]